MSHDQQAQRLREIDDLLAECQRHDMTGVRVSYAQLRALREAIATPVPPAAVAEVPWVITVESSEVYSPSGDKWKDMVAATNAPVAPKGDQHGDCLCCCRKHGGRGFTQGCVKCEQERTAAQAQEGNQ